jgi:hypothetical protein
MVQHMSKIPVLLKIHKLKNKRHHGILRSRFMSRSRHKHYIGEIFGGGICRFFETVLLCSPGWPQTHDHTYYLYLPSATKPGSKFNV